MCREVGSKANFKKKKNLSSLSMGCLGLFIALGAFFEAAALPQNE